MAKNRVTVGLKGTERVIRKLNKKIMRTKIRSMSGLLKAGAFIRRDMDKTPPLIPVDTGNLRSSWTSQLVKGGVYIGFTAKYAPDVEFNENFQGKRPNSGPFFFTSALARNHSEILNIIRNSAKI